MFLILALALWFVCTPRAANNGPRHMAPPWRVAGWPFWRPDEYALPQLNYLEPMTACPGSNLQQSASSLPWWLHSKIIGLETF